MGRGIEIDTLKAFGGLYFENIQQGLTAYPNEIVTLTQKDVIEQIQELWKNQTFQHSFVDFYYFRLEEEAKEKVRLHLTEEELAYLEEYEQQEDGSMHLIFPLDDMLLQITAKLNEREVLFSTYYFIGETEVQTWWGNFQKQYVKFVKQNEKEKKLHKPLSFVVVGSGWRALFFVRIAKQYPEIFHLNYMMCRRQENAEEMAETYDIPTTISFEECVASKPDFVVVSVNRVAIVEIAKQWIEKGVPVLLETPAGANLQELKELWELKTKHGAKIQVAEQYIRYPLIASGLNLIDKGLLGDPYAVTISALHDYHAVSVIRHMLKIGLEPVKIHGKQYVFPVTETDSRYGLITDGSVKKRERTVLTLEFASGKVAFYDFSGVQYHSQIRTRHINVQGQNGEWNDTIVRYVDEQNTAQSQGLLPYTEQAYETFATSELKNREWCSQLIMDREQDEYAIATRMWDMKKLIEEGIEGYPLAEALEDAYIWLLMEEAFKQGGKEVASEKMPWHILERSY